MSQSQIPSHTLQKSSYYLLMALSSIGMFSLFHKSSKIFKSLYPLMAFRPNLKRIYGENAWVAITGSSDGLGKQFAFEFSRYGFHCLLIARNESKIKKVQEELKTAFPKINYKIVLMDFQNVLREDFFKNIEKEFEETNVRILVNNVGVTNISSFIAGSDEEIKQQIFINSYATVLMSKIFINKTLPKQSSNNPKHAVINVGSILGNIPLPYLSSYCGSKAFVNNFSESLYHEFKSRHINVFCLTPYYVSTKMTGYKKLAFDTITPEECVQSGIKQFAWGRKSSSGNWKHEIVSLMLENEWFKEYIIRTKGEFYRDLVERTEKIRKLRRKKEKEKD